MSTELTVVQAVRQSLAKMEPDLRATLPAHVPFAQFARIAQTALQLSPELQQCSPRSIIAACTKCAETGLLPDGEEGALIAYNVNIEKNKDKPARWEKQAKFLPMVRGIRNQVQRSGAVKDWKVRIVYKGDTFRHVDGDVESLVHEPAHIEGDVPVLVYSIAYLENGALSRHVMRMDAVLRIRAKSRSKGSGPWVTDFEEMVKKTCLKQHSKALPKGKEDEAVRVKAALQAIDHAEGLDEEVEQLAPSTPVPMLQAARERLAEVAQDSPFEDLPQHETLREAEEAAGEQQRELPQPPRKPRAPRKTAAEKLAEADQGQRDRAAAAEAKKAGNAASAAPAPSVASVAAPSTAEAKRPIDWREGDDMPANMVEEDGRDLAYEAACAADGPPENMAGTLDDEPDESEEDPDAAAYRDGFTKRMTGKSRVPDRAICQDQGTASAWLNGYDEAARMCAAGTQPKSFSDMEAALDELVGRTFA